MQRPWLVTRFLWRFEGGLRKCYSITELDAFRAKWEHLCKLMKVHVEIAPDWTEEKRQWRWAVARVMSRHVEQDCEWRRQYLTLWES